MPIYEYACRECGKTFETMQAISAKPLKTCQGLGCNGKANGQVQRLVSSTGFVLKGGGWYASDYPSEARKKGMESERTQANPAPAPAAGGGCGSGCGHDHGAPAATPPAAATPAPAATKTVAASNSKNPYSSGKKKKRTAGAR